ncbi:MAG: ParB/RepB/Spo0J family partition protein [Sulfitobacter sp.]
MTLQFIELENLTVSPLNVRKYGAKDCTDLVTSIRALGILQPLLVREIADGYEVIAGQRRLNACRIIAEDSEIEPLPCMVMSAGDDATAIEASLAENIERLPMDEIDQYKAFAKLLKEGRTPEDVAQTFGITERMVSQRLALGRLYAPILTAYRNDDLNVCDIRILTMATIKQQKAWWALVKDENEYAPTGQRLKAWLFGGAHIPTSHALFDVDASGLAVVSDLFGEDAYFADSEAFWVLQNAEVANTVEAYKVDGWSEVVVTDVGAYFAAWDYRAAEKDEGGRVYVVCTNKGEVSFHEGYITNAEAKRRDKAESGATPAPKPELTKAAQNYVDLHRHAAVRADLLGQGATALRLIAAHMIAGSSLWQVEADPQKVAKPEIAESLENNTGHQAMEAERAAIKELLGLADEDGLLGSRAVYTPRPCITDVFAKLQSVKDADVLRVLTFLMADSLSVRSPLINSLGAELETEMAAHWQPDVTFIDLIRDKQVLNAMVGELAGENAAKEHVTATAKTQKAILNACLDGTRKAATENWMPRCMAFPQGSYRAVAERSVTDETVDVPKVQQAA